MDRHRIASQSIAPFVSQVGFLVLFPGFFFYHLGVSSGFLPNVFLGLFGPASVVLTFIFLFCSPTMLARARKEGRTVLFIFGTLFFYCTIWFVIQHYSTRVPYGGDAAVQVVTLLFSWLALFFMGVALPYERAGLRKAVLISFVAIGCVALALFDSDTLMFNPRSLYDVSEGTASYQGYARSAFLVGLFLLGSCSAFQMKLAVVVSSVTILFLLGARSELFGFAALAAVVFVLDSVRSIKKIIAILLAVLAAGLFLVSNMDILLLSRQTQVLDLNSASSWVLRRQYQDFALGQISESPFFGLHAGHFEAGGVGAYAHNALSAWVSFGIVGFVGYVGLTVYCLVVSLKKYIGDPRSVYYGFPFFVNFVSLLLIFLSKPVFWTVPALGWGLVVNMLVSARGVVTLRAAHK